MPRRRITKATSVAGLITALAGSQIPGTAAPSAAYAQAVEQDPPHEQATDEQDPPADQATDEQDPPADQATDEQPTDSEAADTQAAEQPQVATPAATPAAPQAIDPAEAAIKAKVRGFLGQLFDVNHLPAPKDDEDLFALGMVGSLLALRLVAFVEKEFGVPVVEEDVSEDNYRPNFGSVNAITKLVMRKKK